MEVGVWRRALRGDLRELEAFLRSREERAAGFIGRILRGGVIRLPHPLSGAIWIRAVQGAPIKAALLGLASGVYFPQLPDGVADTPGLCEALGGGPGRISAGGLRGDRVPSSVIGPASSVEAFESALGAAPEWRVEYRLMARRLTSAPPGRFHEAIDIHSARPVDLAELYPLQRAYEEEEVITPLHSFEPEACRASLAKALGDQIIVVARTDRAVGKAGTNARAFTHDQIGGVFVTPRLRGRGIGHAMMVCLLEKMAVEGRASVLFVKKSNIPALRLYEGLGYAIIDEFRADYFART